MKDEKIIKEIDRYIKGDLTPKEIDNLWAEFLKKPEYYRWFETELYLVKMAKDKKTGNIHRLEKTSDKKNSGFKSYKKWALAAAAVLIISVGLQLFSIDGSGSVYNQAITKIDSSELAGADIYRSDEEVSNRLDVIINQGLALAYEGENEAAIETFKNILTQDPTEEQRARAELNLGILLYNMGDYEEAVIYFESVTQIEEITNFFEEKAWWFLGNAYLNLRQLSDARKAVFNAYTLDGRYQSPALSLLKNLDIELGIIPSESENREIE